MAKSTVAVRFTGEGAGLQGLLGDLDSKFGGFGQKITSAIGPAGLAFGGLASAAVGVGAALFKVGSDFDEQFDKIRAATGRTGKSLDVLKQDFKNVVSDVPTDFASAGDAVSKFSQGLATSGKSVEGLSEQMLELSRITKTDLNSNVDASLGVIKSWNLQGKDMGSTMDLLFRASQQSGASFSDLSSELQSNSVTFKALGFNVEQATTVLAGLAKGGIDASQVMPALGKAIAAGAKEGKSAQDVYQGLIRSIKDAPSDTAAATVAFDVLGAKAGPKFAALVRSGKFSFDQLGESIAEGSDTILKAGKDTQDFGEKWELIKNRVLVALEPVATKVFDAMGTAMDKLGPILTNQVMPAFAALGAWWQQNGPAIMAQVKQVFDTISQVISSAVTVITALWNTFGSSILASVKGTFEGIAQQIKGVMEIIQGVIQTVMALIHGDWGQAWDGIKQIFTGVWDYLAGFVKQIMASIHLLISAGWTVIKGVFSGALDAIKNVVSTAFKDVVKFFKDLPGNLVKALGDVSKLLEKAGLAIIKSLLNGIKQGFEDVKHFVGGIAHKITSLKGPLEYDATLLVPHGNAIMQSLYDGLQAKYGPLLDFVRSIAAGVSSEFDGSAGLSFNGSLTGGPAQGSIGAGAGGPIVIQLNLDSRQIHQVVVSASELALRRNGPAATAIGF